MVEVPAPLLDVDDLVTHFRTARGVVRAVDHVSLTVRYGEALGVVGESGAGKTVLSRSIIGLLSGPEVVRSGSVRFGGAELVGLPDDELRRRWGTDMAMVFQDPTGSLNPLMRVGEQVAEALRAHLGMTRRHARQAALGLLADVRIPDPERRARQYPHELSGGMRQRVMIAIALSCGPQLLFADEPTTALDVTVQAQILALLAEQRRRRGMAVVLVTHDLGVVAGHTDRVAVMYAGRIVEQAPTSVLFSDVKMPYTEALIASIPALDAPSHARLLTIPGRPPDLVDPPAGCAFAPRCPYARDRCRAETPPLVAAASADHHFACWYPVGSPEYRERKSTLPSRGP